MKQTYVLDVMVENLIIIELKAMEGILPVHEAHEIVAKTKRHSHQF